MGESCFEWRVSLWHIRQIFFRAGKCGQTFFRLGIRDLQIKVDVFPKAFLVDNRFLEISYIYMQAIKCDCVEVESTLKFVVNWHLFWVFLWFVCDEDGNFGDYFHCAFVTMSIFIWFFAFFHSNTILFAYFFAFLVAVDWNWKVRVTCWLSAPFAKGIQHVAAQPEWGGSEESWAVYVASLQSTQTLMKKISKYTPKKT